MAANLSTALVDLYALEDHFGMRSSQNNGLLDILDMVFLSTGINPQMQLNDCETVGDWTEETDTGGAGTGYFDVTAEAVNMRVGAGATTLTATAAYDAVTNYMITTNYINGSAVPGKNKDGLAVLDLRKYDYIGFWMYGATGFDTATELEIALKDYSSGSAAWSSGLDLNTAAVASVHVRAEIDITTLTRNKVSHFGFINKNTTASDAVDVGEIIAYKFGNGWGPVGGACIWLPIKNAVTVTKGNILEYEASTTQRCDLEAAAEVGTLGPCVIGGTGNASGSVLACIQIGGFTYLQASAATIDGEGLEWAAGHTVAGVANTIDELAFAIGLEAAGAASDVIPALLSKATTFIS